MSVINNPSNLTQVTDMLLVNGVAVVNPFSASILVNGISPVGEIEVNGYPVANNTPCMVQRPVNLAYNSGRVQGVVYQNTSQFPILVQAMMQSNTANVVWTAVADASPAPTTVVYKSVGCNNAANNQLTLTFFVFPGQYYKVTASTGTSTTGGWNEFFCQTGTMTDSGEIHASRSLATVFHNTSGKTMFVAAQISGVSAASSVQGVSDTTPTPANVIDDATQTSSGANTVTVFFIVPNGHYYKVTAASGSLALWHEYTWNIPCTKSPDLVSAAGGWGILRWSHAVAISLNTGAAVGVGTQQQMWLNNTPRVRWVQQITTNTTGASFISFTSGDGWPGNFTIAYIAQATNQPRHLYGPVLPWNPYGMGDTAANVLADVHWWEYQLG